MPAFLSQETVYGHAHHRLTLPMHNLFLLLKDAAYQHHFQAARSRHKLLPVAEDDLQADKTHHLHGQNVCQNVHTFHFENDQ